MSNAHRRYLMQKLVAKNTVKETPKPAVITRHKKSLKSVRRRNSAAKSSLPKPATKDPRQKPAAKDPSPNARRQKPPT